MTTISLEIDIEGPLLTAGLTTPAYGIDSGFLRDLDGSFILPGTLVKGVALHTLRLMSERAPTLLDPVRLCRWFGQGSGDVRDLDRQDDAGNKSLVPARGMVRFSDLRLVAKAPARLTRIAIDQETGSARRGMLQILETPVGYGKTAEFAGRLTVAGNAGEAKEVADWIGKALRLVPAIGAAKSAGFGHIKAVRCKVVMAPAPAAAHPTVAVAAPIGYTYRLKFTEPLLVASQAISGNLFKSSEDIPGGVVKGALARVIEASGRMPALKEALDRMVIRHAKPAAIRQNGASPVRPRAIPLSLFSVEEFKAGDTVLSEVFDASDETNNPEELASYPALIAFQPDWKPSTKSALKSVKKQLDHTADFQFDIRTRTAIESKGTAATSQLFSRIALDPRGHVWVGEIERGKAAEAPFAEIVEIMRRGLLPGIGKTGATAAVELSDSQPRGATPLPGAKAGYRRWRLVLETDALLHGPDAVHAHGDLLPEARLEAQYRDYFAFAINHRLGAEAVGPGALALRFFARQRWVGGYQALRFPAKPGRYYPHLVTEAGSVFVLDAPEAAKAAFDSFVARGLPLPDGVPEHAMEHQRSPFVPQNGYGEVSIGNYFAWQKIGHGDA